MGTFTEISWRTRFWKNFRFRRHVYANFDFFDNFSPLVNELFKMSAIFCLEIEIFRMQLILHVISDVIGIFEIQDRDHVLCTLPKFKASPSRFVFNNVSNRTKTVLVTLIALITGNLSKILLL